MIQADITHHIQALEAALGRAAVEVARGDAIIKQLAEAVQAQNEELTTLRARVVELEEHTEPPDGVLVNT